MQVREVMVRGIEAVSPLASIEEAAKRMKELQTDLLPVATSNGLIGMLSVRDITVRVTAEGIDPKRTPVEDVMSLGIVACFDDQAVEDALQIMRRKHITEIPVLNRQRKLVGSLSLNQLVARGAV
jgi:CBS domain-containing protein